MDEIPRDFSRDDLKMSQDQIAERDAGHARLAKLFPVADGELPDPFQVNRSLNDFKSHVTAVLSDVLAELRIMRDSTKGSLAEQVAYELRIRAGSTGAPSLDQPTPEDTKRLDHLEAWLDGFEWVHLPTQIEPEVRCDWFAGDGSGHWFTQGKTFREAIDKSLNHEATQESHD